MHVAILGAGRLGRSFALLLPPAGHRVTLWRRDEAVPEADVYLLTVADDQIAEVAGRVPSNRPRLHCSGSRGVHVLGSSGERGVLHPLMTFPGPGDGLPRLAGVGAGVSGTPVARALAEGLARDLGLVPFVMPEDPVRYHAAAVIAGNHAAALLLSAAELLAGPELPVEEARRRLLPLALESLRLAAERGPGALTGPTARGDRHTEELHLQHIGAEHAASYAAVADQIRRLTSSFSR